MLATGHDPLKTYKAIWDGSGLNWFFHFGHYHIDLPFTSHRVFFWWDTNANALAPYNLPQTLILTTTLILTGLAVAFAFRCGMFNIGGQGQYIIGAIVAVWVGSSWAGMAKGLHIFLVIVLAAPRRCCDRRRRRRAEGDRRRARGDHDDHAQLDRATGSAATRSGAAGRCRTRSTSRFPSRSDIVPSAQAADVLGQPGAPGAPHRPLHRARRARRLLADPQPHDARLPGARGRLQPRRRRATAASTSHGTTCTRWRSRASFAGLGGAIDILGWQYRLGVLDIQVSNDRLHRDRRRAARPQHRGRRLAFGAALRRARERHFDARPRPDGVPAAARRQPDADDPGARRCSSSAPTCSCSRSGTRARSFDGRSPTRAAPKPEGVAT